MVVKRKMGTNQQFSLRWNNYLRHITCAFDSLRSDEDLVDVTLSCEGKRIRAHKMLLSACSSYFRDLFKENPCQHPVIIFRNVKFEDLAALVDFMYQGEVNVVQDQLSSFLTTAELLAVQGLSDGNGNDHGSDDPKEVELPDSPLLPPEPEVQLSNNTHGQKQLSTSSSVSGSVSSPVSFFPVDQRPDSPPCNKRRKWGGSVGGTVKSGNNPVLPSRETVEKDGERERETERRRVSAASATSSISKSSQDPIEIIPVPNLKLEMPDYMEQEQDASSCSYSDSNQGGGGSGGGQGSSRDPLPPMSQLLAHGTSTDSKQEPSEMYSTNSGDSTLPPSAESLSASDISQILAKPGPSGENQSQDSLQGMESELEVLNKLASFKSGLSVLHRHIQQPLSTAVAGAYVCELCGKCFKHRNSRYNHMAKHKGTSRCHICHQVLGQKSNMKRHLRHIHGVMGI
ncbi:broad-complex core protein isoforms 1/2/3/4/5-like isoform X14 [Zootermopsis nevadensis]|uniref:broad-complex core protein isoforms 1/2/3/4/5-like isoform X14 n=1 Tax=Zootermopsis nevadensis TaxID=136037 RepID=UPI000B8EA1FB|nr:broad-complex core protein isoforms 1/2/3/4/5-like isoform X14 [Zootermopsis nevadensis]